MVRVFPRHARKTAHKKNMSTLLPQATSYIEMAAADAVSAS
jgi:hypothetical protein